MLTSTTAVRLFRKEYMNLITSQQNWWMMRRTKLASTTSVHPGHMKLMILREN